MILLIDNYDSFTFNIKQYLEELGAAVKVSCNDEVSLEQIKMLAPSAVVISPGPGAPSEAGVSVECVQTFASSIPILGVCLGHQCIAAAFGGRIKSAEEIVHGKVSDIYHQNHGVFMGLPSPFVATRYHSLAVSEQEFPEQLLVTAWTQSKNGSQSEIMGLKHKTKPVEGVQFHPESVLSEYGHRLLKNFIDAACSPSKI